MAKITEKLVGLFTAAVHFCLPERKLQVLREEALIKFFVMHQDRNIQIGVSDTKISFSDDGFDTVLKMEHFKTAEAAVQVMTPALFRQRCENILAETDLDKLIAIIAEADDAKDADLANTAEVWTREDGILNFGQEYADKRVAEDAERYRREYESTKNGFRKRGLDEVVRLFRISFAFALPKHAAQEDFDAMIDPDETQEEFHARMDRAMQETKEETARLKAKTDELIRAQSSDDAPSND